MNQYVTGAIIKKLREKQNLTQQQLANLLNVSDKTVSKWETANGYPDITLLEPLAKALQVSVIELLNGYQVTNANSSSNVAKLKMHVCPVCGNVIMSVGSAVISCHGITLPELETETPNDQHTISVQQCEDEYYVTVSHPMDKTHYVSFLVAVGCNGYQFVKLYPEGNAEARFKINNTQCVYAYCNKHGLFKISL